MFSCVDSPVSPYTVPTLIRSSSSAGETHAWFCRNMAFFSVMVSFWLVSKGLSRAWNTSPPPMRKNTTTTNTATTVLHFITECRAEMSRLASRLATTLAEREEMESLGRGQCPLNLTSQPMGFCMADTLAWTREDWTTAASSFFGGTILVWTATVRKIMNRRVS